MRKICHTATGHLRMRQGVRSQSGNVVSWKRNVTLKVRAEKAGSVWSERDLEGIELMLKISKG